MQNLPAVKQNTTAVAALLGAVKVNPTSSNGGNFLSFDAKRTGEWVLGADKEACTGDVFSLDVASLKHGYIQWHQRKSNTRLVAINQPLPLPQDPIYYTDNKGKEQCDEASEARAFEGTFSDGTRFTLEVNTHGGRKAVDGIITELMQRFAQQSPYLFPQVELASSSYDHKTYGKVYTPELVAVAWFDAEGNEEGKAIAPPVEEEVAKPGVARRRRSA